MSVLSAEASMFTYLHCIYINIIFNIIRISYFNLIHACVLYSDMMVCISKLPHEKLVGLERVGYCGEEGLKIEKRSNKVSWT